MFYEARVGIERLCSGHQLGIFEDQPFVLFLPAQHFERHLLEFRLAKRTQAKLNMRSQPLAG